MLFDKKKKLILDAAFPLYSSLKNLGFMFKIYQCQTLGIWSAREREGDRSENKK